MPVSVPPNVPLLSTSKYTRPARLAFGGVTINVSVVGAALLPTLVCKSPAGIVFGYVPVVLLVTSTAIVQPPLGMLEPLAKTTVLAAAAAVTLAAVLPGAVMQVPPTFGVPATTTPPGSVSVSAVVNVTAIAAGLVLPRVIVNLEIALMMIVLGLKALVIVGRAATVTGALASCGGCRFWVLVTWVF